MNPLWRMILAALIVSGAVQSAWAGIADDVRESLQHGGDPNAWVKQDHGFRTHPLHIVAAAGGDAADRLEAARLLIEAGADVNGRDEAGDTPLHKSVGALNPNVAELLIRHGAKVNGRNKEGETPIFALQGPSSYLYYRRPSAGERQSMTEDMRVLVTLLAQHGADLNTRNEKGETPLIHLAATAPAEVVAQFLELGAEADATDNEGRTALDRAMSSRNVGAARQLAEHGVRATAGQLVYAIDTVRDAGLALALVEAGAELNGTDSAGDSPLCAATLQVRMNPEAPSKDWYRLIDAMLERGANPKSPCGLGGTAYDAAMKHSELSRIFRRQRAPTASAKPFAELKLRKTEKKSPIEVGALGVEDAMFRYVDQSLDLEDAALAAANIRTLPNAKAIPARVHTLERFARLSRRVLQFYEHGGESAWQRTKDAGGSEADADVATEVFRKIMKDPKMIALADRARANAEWAELNIQAYRLLQDNPDKWRFGHAGEKHLVVTDRAFAKQLGELSRRMKLAGARAEEAHERMRRLQRKKD